MTREPPDDSPFHPGERDVQARGGVQDRSEALGRKLIRTFMPEQHRELFARLPLLLVGSVDETGQPWASMLTGAPGFIRAPDAHRLAVRAKPALGDPLERTLHAGAALGLLGIELESRRRNRVNGKVVEVAADGFELRVDQSFGNCPKYIHARRPIATVSNTRVTAPVFETARLSDAAVSLIAASDTVFVASTSARELDRTDPREGADVSHRGGPAGFVGVERTASRTTLLMPDYPGNNAFNTLGNLARYPRAGLLVPDFARGDLLLLACDAEIRWDRDDLAPGRLHRQVVFGVREGVWLAEAMPFRWSSLL